MRSLILCIPVVLLVLSTVTAEEKEISISAFNIKQFGSSKASKPEVMATIVKIVRKYDIILIQEIVDMEGGAIKQLLNEVNEENEEKKEGEETEYEMVLSEIPLGKNKSKEQYAFFYRKTADISVVETYQYPDPLNKFKREPLSVKFSIGGTNGKEIVLIGHHATPSKAVQENDALDDVHKDIQQQMGTENIIILGDLNADCRFVNQTAMPNLILRKDSKYHWLIEDDTTVSATDCAYDRFILTGDDFLQSVVPGSVGVFRFDDEYKLNQTQAAAVSDHYPIQMTLTIGSEDTTTIRSTDPISDSSERSEENSTVRPNEVSDSKKPKKRKPKKKSKKTKKGRKHRHK